MTTSLNSTFETGCLIKVEGGISVRVSYSCFQGASGVQEYHFALRPIKYANFPVQYASICAAYKEALERLGLDASGTVLKRFFCSDAANEVNGMTEEEGAVSWITQPPVTPAKVSMWTYHVHDPSAPPQPVKKRGTTVLQRGELEHCWVSGLAGNTNEDEHEQSLNIFDRYKDILGSHGQNLEENCVRTWFYVSGIDTNYAGMVEARNEVFDQEGLTADNHFIASTGIGGATANPSELVSMDAYSIGGVKRDQIEYLSAPENLGPTHDYGVAFERATAVRYRDRTHVFVSGTASINPAGEIVHPGDIVGQKERTLCNVEALLEQAGAGLDDMSMMIAYVRDPADMNIVHTRIQADYGRIPCIVVLAPVCRPGWLIEIEAIATVKSDNPALPKF